MVYEASPKNLANLIAIAPITAAQTQPRIVDANGEIFCGAGKGCSAAECAQSGQL